MDAPYANIAMPFDSDFSIYANSASVQGALDQENEVHDQSQSWRKVSSMVVIFKFIKN